MKPHQQQHHITQVMSQILNGLTRHPEDLRFEERLTDQSLDLCIMPHVADYQVICGRHGRLIGAIKKFVQLAGLESGIDADIELVQTYRGNPERLGEFRPNPAFDPDAFLNGLFNEMLRLVFRRLPQYSTHRMEHKLRIFIETQDLQEELPVLTISEILHPYGYSQGNLIDVRVSRRN